LGRECLKVLLIKRNITPQKNKWSLPGGFVNVDENIEDAALRKFVEETGIAPAYLSQVRTYSDVKRDKEKLVKIKLELLQLPLLVSTPLIKTRF
jgi:8-oxo-dGTP diphosphatase